MIRFRLPPFLFVKKEKKKAPSLLPSNELIFPPQSFPSISYPGSLLGLQPLHDHHGVHVFIILLVLLVVALLGLLQSFLELPLQHQFPEAVVFFRCSLGLCLQNKMMFRN